jgi:hypothetical protein
VFRVRVSMELRSRKQEARFLTHHFYFPKEDKNTSSLNLKP